MVETSFYVSNQGKDWQITHWEGGEDQLEFDLKSCPYVIESAEGVVLIEVRFGKLVVGGLYNCLDWPEFDVDPCNAGDSDDCWQITVTAPASLKRFDVWAEEEGHREVQRRLTKAAKIRAQIEALTAELAVLSPTDSGV